MLEYLKKNWLGALGLVIGVVGIVLSYFFYSLSIQSREPVFMTLNNVAIFSSSGELTSKYIKLVKRIDDRELSNNLYVQEVVFWNNGKQAIKKTNLLKPLVLSFDQGVEIIDAFITEMGRPDIVKGSIQFKPGDKNVSLEFDILEKNDGIKIQIVYSALKAEKAILKGAIEGVTEIKKISDLKKDNLVLAIAKFTLYVIGFIGAFFIVAFAFSDYLPKAISWLIKKLFHKHHEKINSILGNVFAFIILIAMLFIVCVFIYRGVNSLSESSAIQSVPEMHNIHQINLSSKSQ